MDRKLKILVNALNKEDRSSALERLNLPKYETTKGLNKDELNAVLSNSYKLFNKTDEGKQPFVYDRQSHTQCEKKLTRRRKSKNVDTVSNNLLEETSPEENSGDKYIQVTDEQSDNNIDKNCDSSIPKSLLEETSPEENSGDKYIQVTDEQSDNNIDNNCDSSIPKSIKYRTYSSRDFESNQVGDNELDIEIRVQDQNVDTASNNQLNEMSPEEDSGDEYIPDTDELSDSDTDTSCNSLVSKSESRKYRTYNRDFQSNQVDDNELDMEIQVQDKITVYNQGSNFRTSVVDNNQVKNVSNNEFSQFSRNSRQQIGLNSNNLKKKRVWNKKDYCFFCETEVMKFSRHILRHHQSEVEVQEILALSVGDKRRKVLFNKLRNKGNFLKSATEENIVPVRKPTLYNPDIPTSSTYLPCKYCKGFYKKKYLYRHVKKCPLNNDDKSMRINAQSEGQSLLSACRNNDILRKEVFPIMRADSISFTAKTDTLICAVASRYLKSHRDKQFRLVASRKMRQLGALLMEIRKKIKIKSLLEALDPLNFDIIIECTKIISSYDAETETYGAPSLATNMGTQLKDCIDVAYNILLKKYRKETGDTNKLRILKELITNEWRYEISTLANNDLHRKRWNKPSLIPLAEDLTLLRNYLVREAERLRNSLYSNSHDGKAFKTLQEICYVQLLLLNRRRVGELQRMTVTSYSDNINNQNSSEFDNCISESERILMRSFRRVVIRGKRGRGVPVLFTADMVKTTNLLLQVRQHFVRQKNLYLFANTNSSNSITGTKAVYKHVRLAGVKNAAALTSTKLRKHLATMSQLINLSEQDLEQLATFMGHTSSIHKTYYRLPNDVYQMAKVSKLLLLNERGKASKYKGKSLDEINIDLDVIEEDEEEDSDGTAEGNEVNDIEEGSIKTTKDSANEEDVNQHKIINESTEIIQNKKMDMENKKKKKRVLEPWTDKQKQITLAYFKRHLKKKIPPKKKECVQLQEENPGVFENKSWEKIKIFVVNNYVKT